jgi:hypothetical protein
MEATRQAGRLRPDLRSVRGIDALSAVVLLYGASSLAVAVGGPITQLLQPGGQVAVGLNGSGEDALGRLPGLPPGTSLEVGSQSELLLSASSLPWWLRLLTEAPAAVAGLCGALGAFLVWRLLRDARAGRTFEAKSPDRLVALAAVVLVASLGSQLLDGVARAAVLDHVDAEGPGSPLVWGFELDLTAVLLGFVLVALAEAFRHGRRLTQDVDGLV